jgi:predicted MFS family arabinose efflux permease
LRAEKTDLGIAAAAAVTGALMRWFGWRAAFALPGLARLALGVLFMRVVPPETESPAKRRGGAQLKLSRSLAMHALAVMTVASATGCILFNLATNGSGQLLAERFQGAVRDPATLGLLLASIYAVASLAQVIVGRLIDRVALKPLYLGIALLQVPVLAFSAHLRAHVVRASRASCSSRSPAGVRSSPRERRSNSCVLNGCSSSHSRRLDAGTVIRLASAAR